MKVEEGKITKLFQYLLILSGSISKVVDYFKSTVRSGLEIQIEPNRAIETLSKRIERKI